MTPRFSLLAYQKQHISIVLVTFSSADVRMAVDDSDPKDD